jgi:DNA-binding winged helix-turn-helix (wHTH) protein
VIVSFGGFTFHGDRRQLFREGTEVHLTPKAFDLLALLIERAPSVVAKTDIHRHLWPETFVSDATLVGLVKELRRALADGDGRGSLIRTAHAVGYAFAGPIAADEPPGAATHWVIAGTLRFALRDGVNVIGRDPDAAVWVDAPGVSRRHAQIVLEKGTASLEDLGSKNGTLVGDRPARGRIELRHGDRIQVASAQLIFNASTTEVSTATELVPQRRPKE